MNNEDKDPKTPKILFVHHTAMWYRKPFFRDLSQIHNVEFLFTNVEGYNKTYTTDFSQEIPEMEGVNYQVITNHLGIAWGAIKRTMGDYDVFVGGSWDNPTDLLETIFYFVIVKLKRKPFILWREDWDWNVKTLKRKIVKTVAGFIARNADAILVPGTKHMKFFTNLGVLSEKIFIMPNVSNITIQKQDYENKAELIKELRLENKKVVLFVGRLIPLKGVQFLLPAFKNLTQTMADAVLLIVGEGECQDKLQEITKELEIENKVIFTGNIDNELMGAYYLLSNIFVLPSITTHHADACPLVVNEAMYFGKPVVTSDAVGTTFMIEDGVNGFVVPEMDSKSLEKAMHTILSDPSLEKSMGEVSNKIIEEGFRYQNMIDGFNAALKYIQK